MNPLRNDRATRRRKGAVLVVTLVCLVIVMALIGQMLVFAVRNGRQLRAERDLVQCEILLQAGVDHAARRLAADHAARRLAADAENSDRYDGEELEVPASEMGGAGAGRVSISVTRPAGESPRIRVQAEYPLKSERSIRRSLTFTLRDRTLRVRATTDQ